MKTYYTEKDWGHSLEFARERLEEVQDVIVRVEELEQSMHSLDNDE